MVQHIEGGDLLAGQTFWLNWSDVMKPNICNDDNATSLKIKLKAFLKCISKYMLELQDSWSKDCIGKKLTVTKHHWLSVYASLI